MFNHPVYIVGKKVSTPSCIVRNIHSVPCAKLLSVLIGSDFFMNQMDFDSYKNSNLSEPVILDLNGKEIQQTERYMYVGLKYRVLALRNGDYVYVLASVLDFTPIHTFIIKTVHDFSNLSESELLSEIEKGLSLTYETLAKVFGKYKKSLKQFCFYDLAPNQRTPNEISESKIFKFLPGPLITHKSIAYDNLKGKNWNKKNIDSELESYLPNSMTFFVNRLYHMDLWGDEEITFYVMGYYLRRLEDRGVEAIKKNANFIISLFKKVYTTKTLNAIFPHRLKLIESRSKVRAACRDTKVSLSDHLKDQKKELNREKPIRIDAYPTKFDINFENDYFEFIKRVAYIEFKNQIV